jgi:hypothetical protein
VSSTIRTAELIDAMRAAARLKQRDAREGRLQPATTWLLFAARLAQAQVPFVALVPYPPAALPRPMLERIAVVQWDRPAVLRSRVSRGARWRGRGGWASAWCSPGHLPAPTLLPRAPHRLAFRGGRLRVRSI